MRLRCRTEALCRPLRVLVACVQEGPKRLVLLRHAKSEWEVPEIDRDRPLALRGHKEAAEMGRCATAAACCPRPRRPLCCRLHVPAPYACTHRLI